MEGGTETETGSDEVQQVEEDKRMEWNGMERKGRRQNENERGGGGGGETDL